MFEKGISMRGKKGAIKTVAVLIILISFVITSTAQTPVTLQAAIDTAVNNNLLIRSETLNADYLQKLKGTAFNLPQTGISLEYGQFNSIYGDNRLNLLQSVRFPTVYARQKALYNEEWKSGLLNVAVRQYEVRKQVTRVYYQMIYLLQKQTLLHHTDSLFATFLENAELRLKVGETNVLEKTTAETLRGQISVQLKELQQDFSVLQLQFKYLLNTSTNFVPAETILQLSVPQLYDTSALQQNPIVRQLQQQQQTSLARLELEKSRLLPDLFIGYNNMTIRGTGADNKVYSSSKRFQSVQVGVGIPLFRGAQRATIAAGRINVRLTENNYAQGLQQLQTAYQQAIREYEKNQQTITYYQNVALKNANTIIETANLQFRNGEINYLEWVLLTNNAITIESQYIEVVRALNQSIIDINSFITQ